MKPTRSKRCGKRPRERQLRLGRERACLGKPWRAWLAAEGLRSDRCSRAATDQSHAVSSCSFSVRQPELFQPTQGVVGAEGAIRRVANHPPLPHIPAPKKKPDSKKQKNENCSQEPLKRRRRSGQAKTPKPTSRTSAHHFFGPAWVMTVGGRHHRLPCARHAPERGSDPLLGHLDVLP